MADVLALLQAALTGRYTLERELGRGGMATVYLAVDLKHHRNVAIKVLRHELATVLGPERFLREIEIAAQLNHPHIVPLHDSGGADGFLYYVMPYVEGESLRSRLIRERQLSLDEALQIAQEVADALSYAHGRDVVHRDIKPENILLSLGHALVTDFGIARAVTAAGGDRLTQTGITVGTPGYMSPEQAAGSAQLDGRSDIYSLACVLYEMLGGDPPFMGSSPQAILARQSLEPVPRLRTLRDTVPEGVERAVTKALARAPADRFATAAEFAGALVAQTEARGERRRHRILRIAPAVVAAGALVAVAAVVLFYPRSGVAFDQRDWILITDVKNATGDPLFDRSLSTALTAGIEQSKYVNVFPRSRVRQTLERMQRAGADTLLDETLADEVAQREGIRAVVASEIGQIDNAYVITARIVDPSTGVALKTETVRARGREQVLQALDGQARRLRRDLGESFLSVVRRSFPLPHATTASLDALKKFADGQRAWDGGGWREAQELWRSAIARDSNFALAHAALGGLYYWLNDRPSGEAHLRKALSLLDRLTDREQQWIRAQAAGWRGDREEASNILKALLVQYPDDRRAWFSLGYTYLQWGRCREALDAYAKLLAIDSLDPKAYLNIATCHTALGEPEQALTNYQKAFNLNPNLTTWEYQNHQFGGTYVLMGRLDDARAVFEKMLAGTALQQARGHRSLALLEMFRGRYRSAVAHLWEAVARTRAQNAQLSEARDHLFLAAAFQAQRKIEEFRSEMNAVYGIFKSAYLEPRFLLFAGKVYARGGDVRRASELLDTLVRRVNTDSPSDRASALALQGEIALAKGNAADAVHLFESALPLEKEDETNYIRESLAYALAEHGNLDEAVRRYKELAGHTEFGWEAQEYWLLANYRLGQLYEAKRDTTAAIRSYAAFLDFWKEADKDLPDLIDARNRLRRLRAPERIG